jgi:thiamine-phosphate pyrophosphorylase
MKCASLQFITSEGLSLSHAQQAKEACLGGVRWIQLRVKGRAFVNWLKIAHEVKAITDEFGATLILNDSVEVAYAVDACGVHLGREDGCPQEARKKLKKGAIVGATAHYLTDIDEALAAHVSYIGVGPLRTSQTKLDTKPPLGISGILERVQRAKDTPVYAIGGITKEDVPALLCSGVAGVCVAGSIARAKDPRAAAQELVNQIRSQKMDAVT